MRAGDVVVGMLAGAIETKVRPAVVVASDEYLRDRPDVLVGVLTTKIPTVLTSTDHLLRDWQTAGLRTESCFRAFVLTIHRSRLTTIGRLSDADWSNVQACVRKAFAL